jgi:hypothetical protein
MLLVPFAKYLTKYASEWKISSIGTSLMIPKKEFHFNSLMFREKRLSLSVDCSWEFIASVIIVDAKDFEKEVHTKLYQRLKGFECIMIEKGLFNKRRSMISNPVLSILKEKALPNLDISSTLTSFLNEDRTLQDSFSIIKPDNVALQLYSSQGKSKNVDDFCKEFIPYYENPDQIIWNIIIEKFLGMIVTRGRYTRTLDAIIEALDLIAKNLEFVV